MYVVIRKYSTSLSKEIQNEIPKTLIPKLKQLPGFVQYKVIELPNGNGLSISTYNDKLSAEKTNEIVRAWLAEHKFELPKPEIIEGTVII